MELPAQVFEKGNIICTAQKRIGKYSCFRYIRNAPKSSLPPSLLFFFLSANNDKSKQEKLKLKQLSWAAWHWLGYTTFPF